MNYWCSTDTTPCPPTSQSQALILAQGGTKCRSAWVDTWTLDRAKCRVPPDSVTRQQEAMERACSLNVVQSLSRVQLFATPLTAAHQAPLSSTISWSLLKFTSIELVMPSNHLSLWEAPFSSCLQSFPASGSFQMSWLFTSGGQSIEASASVLPVNIQGWLPFGLTGLIPLLSKGLSRVFSGTMIRKHQFFSAQPSLWSNSHIRTAKWCLCFLICCLGLSVLILVCESNRRPEFCFLLEPLLSVCLV